MHKKNALVSTRLASVVLLFSTIMTLPTTASAVPAFARQTSMPCSACHFQHFPALNSFGRSFRAGGYTLTGGQSQIEGDGLSIPSVLNMSAIAKIRYAKTNGNTDAGTDYGQIQWPDEAALLVGGKMAKDVGFLFELGLADGTTNFLSTKLHFNVANVGGSQFSIIPFSTDGLGVGYGFELLNTGAQRSQRAIENRKGYSAGNALGLTSGAATGIAFALANADYFLNYSLWGAVFGNGDSTHISMDAKPSGLSHYFRAAMTPNIGGWDTGFGVQLWSGEQVVSTGGGAVAHRAAGPGEAALATGGWIIDGQMQGSVGGMPLGVYGSYGTCKTDRGVTSHFAGGPCNNADDGTAFGITAELGVIPGKMTVYLAGSSMDDGSTMNPTTESMTIGTVYNHSQNIRLDAYYVKESGNAVDARASRQDNLLMIMLFAGF